MIKRALPPHPASRSGLRPHAAAPQIRLPTARRLARRPPPRRSLASFLGEWDTDGFFSFALFTATLFIGTLGTAGAALVSMLALAYIVVRTRQLGEILVPRAFILIIPTLAILSLLWSQARDETIKYSLEYAMTVGVAMLLSAAPRPKAVLWGMFPAFAISVLVALAFGGTVGVGDTGETAFSGITASKNLMGDIAATGLLISLACLVAGIEDRRPVRAILALATVLPQTYVVIEARSAGALLALAPALATFFFLLALRPARLALRLLATSFAWLCVAVVAISFGGTFIRDSMTAFDKGPTLTGRTYLWYRAGNLIADKPLLGRGYHAFWVHGNLDAEGLWQYAGIGSRTGFNFHDTAIEILVHFGWVGLIIIGTIAIVATVLLVRRALYRPNLALCFWVSLLAYELVRTPIESLGLVPFAYTTVLIFAAFGSALPARRLVAKSAKLADRRLPRFRAGRIGALSPRFSSGPLKSGRFPGYRGRR